MKNPVLQPSSMFDTFLELLFCKNGIMQGDEVVNEAVDFFRFESITLLFT